MTLRTVFLSLLLLVAGDWLARVEHARHHDEGLHDGEGLVARKPRLRSDRGGCGLGRCLRGDDREVAG